MSLVYNTSYLVLKGVLQELETGNLTVSSGNMNLTNQTEMCPPPKPEWQNFDQVVCIKKMDLDTFTRPQTSSPEFLPFLIIYSLIFVLGLGSNALILTVLLKSCNSNFVNMFLISLTFSDLTFIAACAPYEALVKYTGFYTTSDGVCKMSAFMEMMTTSAAVSNLTLAGIQR